jgi:hypothetical protein
MRRARVLICFLVCILAWSCKRVQEQTREATAPAHSEPTALNTAAPKEFSIVATGYPFGLHFADGVLDFCDDSGGRELNLKTGKQVPKDRSCTAKDEPNVACSGLGLDVEVRAPLSDPNDIVDVGGSSFPLKGRVHDCAADGKLLAVITASTTVVINTTKSTTTQVSPEGGDRVALANGWVAWTVGSNVHAVVLNPI